MKVQSNFIVRRLLLVAIISFLAGAVCTAQTTADRQWKVKYESGTEPLAKGAKLGVTIGADNITGQPEKGQSFSIPISSITEVSYDTVVKKRTKQGAALMIASPLAGLILMGSKSTRHYVNITSKVDGQDRDVSLEIPKGDKDAFLSEMQRVTNHPWRDLAAERTKTETELDHLKKSKIAIQIDRKARVGDAELKPGLYQIVLLERPDNKSELYFFAGKDVKPQKSVANSAVDITPQSGNPTTAQVKYEDTSGGAVVSEIQTESKTFRLRNQ